MATLDIKIVLIGPPRSERIVQAECFGIWGAHYSVDANGEYSVTHIPSGLRLLSKIPSPKAARYLAWKLSQLPIPEPSEEAMNEVYEMVTAVQESAAEIYSTEEYQKRTK